jgi:hypothetical protein
VLIINKCEPSLRYPPNTVDVTESDRILLLSAQASIILTLLPKQKVKLQIIILVSQAMSSGTVAATQGVKKITQYYVLTC